MNPRLVVFIGLGALGGAAVAWQLARDVRPSPQVAEAKPKVADPAAVDASRQAAASAPRASTPTSSNSSPPAVAEVSDLSRPFEVSASVHDFCGNTEWLACREVEIFLDEMAAEPRDAQWASAIEARIESALATGLQGHARIRSLECRQSRCALEYAMPAELGDLPLEVDLSFGGTLVSNTGLFLPERNSATGTFMVHVLTWRRVEAETVPSDD